MARLDVERLAALRTVDQCARPDSGSHQCRREVRVLQGVARPAQNHNVSRIVAKLRMGGVRLDMMAVKTAGRAALLALPRFGNALGNHLSRSRRALRHATFPTWMPNAALSGVLAGIGAEASLALAGRPKAQHFELTVTDLASQGNTQAGLSRPHRDVAGHRAGRRVLSDLAQIALKGLGADRANKASNLRSVLTQIDAFSAWKSFRHNCHRYRNRTEMSMLEAA